MTLVPRRLDELPDMSGFNMEERRMAWVSLVVAGIFEIGWTTGCNIPTGGMAGREGTPEGSCARSGR